MKKVEADAAPTVESLFASLQASFATFKEKEAAKDKAGEAYNAATKDYEAALTELDRYRAQLNEMLGTATGNPRIRMSA